jgi:hypothetical protein
VKSHGFEIVSERENIEVEGAGDYSE